MTSTTVEVLRAERRFFDALLAGDDQALERVLAPDFLIVDVHAGGVAGRAEFIGAVKSGSVGFEAIESFDAETVSRIYQNVAVLVGRTRMRFAVPEGGSVAVNSRYTHVFVTGQGDGWRLASAQGTAIATSGE